MTWQFLGVVRSGQVISGAITVNTTRNRTETKQQTFVESAIAAIGTVATPTRVALAVTLDKQNYVVLNSLPNTCITQTVNNPLIPASLTVDIERLIMSGKTIQTLRTTLKAEETIHEVSTRRYSFDPNSVPAFAALVDSTAADAYRHGFGGTTNNKLLSGELWVNKATGSIVRLRLVGQGTPKVAPDRNFIGNFEVTIDVLPDDPTFNPALPSPCVNQGLTPTATSTQSPLFSLLPTPTRSPLFSPLPTPSS